MALLGATLAWCQPPPTPRPACNAANRGRFWPEQANHDPHAIHKLAQSGELELCTLDVWKHRWQKMSVNARQAKPKRTVPPASESARLKKAWR